MVPNEIILVRWALMFFGAAVGLFLSIRFLEGSVKEEQSSLRSFGVLSLGITIGAYSFPLLYIFAIYPTYFVDTMLEYPHMSVIFLIVPLLIVGYMCDREALNASKADSQS